MLKKLFGKIVGTGADEAKPTPPAPAPFNPALEGMLSVIEEQRKSDPMIGAKLGSREVTHRLMQHMQTERGVHIESMLCLIGSLAGYSCQASVRAETAARGKGESTPFAVARGADGKDYFFGDALNGPLAENQYSVWGLAAAGAQQAGCTTLPEVGEFFRHAAATVGSPEFGIPRIIKEHQPHDLPINYLRLTWPGIHPLAMRFCPSPSEWPILYGLSAQSLIEQGAGVIDPTLALTIVMECAVPMSKVDLSV